MIEELAIYTKPQIVAACSFWSDQVLHFANELIDPVCIITSAIEAVIKSEVQLVGFTYTYAGFFFTSHVRILYAQRHQKLKF